LKGVEGGLHVKFARRFGLAANDRLFKIEDYWREGRERFAKNIAYQFGGAFWRKIQN